ncbi:MAG: diguanylate cyclase [Oscillospiraceae bacterium]|nr:diguanylate cyclase [Oscillospiraceae bacterium]
MNMEHFLDPRPKVKNSILIVDDDPLGVIALYNALNADYALYAVKDGQSAINKALELKPDLIVMDIFMPEMSGFEVMALLKQQEETRDIPIILITGLDEGSVEEKGLQMGAVDYISKPFSETIVKLRINNQLKVINAMRTINQMSITDCLTDAFNRRYFDHMLEQEWLRAIRDKTPLSVLLIDVDLFKAYNDTYGHIQGDIALVRIANAVKSALKRSVDIVARWGGEEFAVIMPNTNIEGAEKIADDLRTAIEKMGIPARDGSLTFVTVSIGVNSTTPGSGGTVTDFISGADKALYAAKDAGRNNVCSAI